MDVQSPTCLLQFCAASAVLSLFPTCSASSVVLDVVPHTELELRTRATHTSAQAHTTGQADIKLQRKDNQETYDNFIIHCRSNTTRETVDHKPYFASKGTDRRIGFLTVAISYMYQD